MVTLIERICTQFSRMASRERAHAAECSVIHTQDALTWNNLLTTLLCRMNASPRRGRGMARQRAILKGEQA